jgi:hypothetical protein
VHRLLQRGSNEPAPSRCGLEPSYRETLPWSVAVGRDRELRGSFDGTVEATGRATEQHLGKRRVEDLTARAAVDFVTLYLQRQPPTGAVTDVLVISCNDKGIFMRPLRCASRPPRPP